MAKPPLVVLLGAGATAPIVPGVAAITDKLLGWKSFRAPRPGYGMVEAPLVEVHADDRPGLFEFLRDGYRDYWAERTLNFEEMIHVLELLDSVYPLPPHIGAKDAFRPLIGPWIEARGDVNLFSNFGFVAEAACKLVLDTVADACDEIASGARSRPALVGGLQALSQEFDLRIFSLNYDDVPDLAGLNAETGYPHGTALFDPFRLVEMGEGHWHCQLHGSVLFGDGDLVGGAVPRYATRTEAKEHRLGYGGGQQMQDGHQARPLAMVTGLRKADKVLHEPFATYYGLLRHTLLTTDRWLIVGYGGGDPHINHGLRSAQEARGQRGDPLRVSIIDYVPDAGPVEAYLGGPGHALMSRLLNWARVDFRDYLQAHALPKLRRSRLNEISDRIRLSVDGTGWAFGAGLDSLQRALRG